MDISYNSNSNSKMKVNNKILKKILTRKIKLPQLKILINRSLAQK